MTSIPQSCAERVSVSAVVMVGVGPVITTKGGIRYDWHTAERECLSAVEVRYEPVMLTWAAR